MKPLSHLDLQKLTNINVNLVLVVFVLVLSATPLTLSSRYLRKSESNGTSSLVSLYHHENDSIQEFLDICTSGSSLSCPLNNITNVTLRATHEKFLAVAKERVLWSIARHKNPLTLAITSIIFVVCLVCGIYLVLIDHLDWRQFRKEIVSDGSFGFYLTIIKSMKFQVVRISSDEYERIIDEKLKAALRTEETVVEPYGGPRRRSTISEDVRRRTKILTREELHEQEIERRKLRGEERKRIENEEVLITLQLKKAEDVIAAQKQGYYSTLLDKFPLPNESTEVTPENNETNRN